MKKEVNKITTEFFKPEKHYQAVCDWWKKQDWPNLPLTHLPAIGVVACSNGTPAMCGWLYKSDSAVCWIEWIVANPEIRGSARDEAMTAMLEGLKNEAGKLGFKAVLTSASNESLVSRLEKNNFQVTDRSVTWLISHINGGSQCL